MNTQQNPTVSYVLKSKSGKTQVVTYQRKKYISQEMIDDMREMDKKFTRKFIGEKYGISVPTVRKYVNPAFVLKPLKIAEKKDKLSKINLEAQNQISPLANFHEKTKSESVY